MDLKKKIGQPHADELKQQLIDLCQAFEKPNIKDYKRILKEAKSRQESSSSVSELEHFIGSFERWEAAATKLIEACGNQAAEKGKAAHIEALYNEIKDLPVDSTNVQTISRIHNSCIDIARRASALGSLGSKAVLEDVNAVLSEAAAVGVEIDSVLALGDSNAESRWLSQYSGFKTFNHLSLNEAHLLLKEGLRLHLGSHPIVKLLRKECDGGDAWVKQANALLISSSKESVRLNDCLQQAESWPKSDSPRLKLAACLKKVQEWESAASKYLSKEKITIETLQDISNLEADDPVSFVAIKQQGVALGISGAKKMSQAYSNAEKWIQNIVKIFEAKTNVKITIEEWLEDFDDALTMCEEGKRKVCFCCIGEDHGYMVMQTN